MAAAAASPASAAAPVECVSTERKNHSVVSAHSGIRIVLALYFHAKKLKNGISISAAMPAMRLG